MWTAPVPPPGSPLELFLQHSMGRAAELIMQQAQLSISSRTSPPQGWAQLAGCLLILGCSLAAPWLLLGCSLALPWLLLLFSLAAPWLLLGCSMAGPWLLLGHHLATPWLLHGCSMAPPWLLHGCSLATPSLLLGYSLAAPGGRDALQRSGCSSPAWVCTDGEIKAVYSCRNTTLQPHEGSGFRGGFFLQVRPQDEEAERELQ